MKKIFISSTSLDLRTDSLKHFGIPNYILSLKHSLEKLNYHVFGMENMGNSGVLPKAVCFDEIEKCDIFIGIYAHRYGSILGEDTKSITEQEYDYAKSLNKTIHCYLIDDNYSFGPPQNENYPKLLAFKKRLEAENTMSEKFTTSDSLINLIISDLSKPNLAIQNEQNSESILKYYQVKIKSSFSKINTLSGTPISGLKQDQFEIHDIYLPLTFSSINDLPEKAEFLGDKEENILDTIYQKEPAIKLIEKESIGYFFKNSKKLFVLGTLGQGKSILCNWLMTSFAEKNLGSEDFKKFEDYSTIEELNLTPIILKCKSLSGEKLPRTLSELIELSLIQNQIDGTKIEALTKVLSKKAELGELLVIVDGFDEIRTPQLLIQFSENLNELSQSYENSYFLLTSRVNSFKEIQHKIGGGFKSILVDELDNEKRIQLINKFSKAYNLPEDTHQKILGSFKDSYTEAFLKTPLILTNVFLLYTRNKKVPRSIQELYEAVFELMFERVSEEIKMVNYQDNNFRKFLGWFGYYLTKNNQKEFFDEEFFFQIENYLAYTQQNKWKHDSKDLLSYLSNTVGIFSIVNTKYIKAEYKKVYEFRHKSYQEFLAGLALAFQIFPGNEPNNSIEKIIDDHISSYQELSFFYNNLEVKYLSIIPAWFESVAFCLNILGIETIQKVVRNIISDKDYLCLSENQARRFFAAKLILETDLEVEIDLVRQIYLLILEDLNEFDSLNLVTPKSIRDNLLAEFQNSKWYDEIYEWLINYYIENYSSNSKYYLILFILYAYPNDNWLNEKLDSENIFQKLIKIHSILWKQEELFSEKDLVWIVNLLKNNNHSNSIKLLGITVIKEAFRSNSIPKNIAVSRIRVHRKDFEDLLNQTRDQNIIYQLIYILFHIEKLDLVLDEYVEKLYSSNDSELSLNFTAEQIEKGEILYHKFEECITNHFYKLNLEQRLCFFSKDFNKTSSFLVQNIKYYDNKVLLEFIFPFMVNLDRLSYFQNNLLNEMLNSDDIFIRGFGQKIINYKEEKIFDNDLFIKSRKDRCYNVRGTDSTGRKAYYFVLIKKNKIEDFLKHKVGDNYNLEDYGNIIYSAYGEDVPEEVKEMLREKYDFDNF